VDTLKLPEPTFEEMEERLDHTVEGAARCSRSPSGRGTFVMKIRLPFPVTTEEERELIRRCNDRTNPDPQKDLNALLKLNIENGSGRGEVAEATVGTLEDVED
jgi:hypothetical protein